MQSIKITQKSLDAFKKEKALVPALLDEKDITTDWAWMIDYEFI